MNNNTEQKLASKNINPTAMRLLVLDSLLQQHSAVGRLVFPMAVRYTILLLPAYPVDKKLVHREVSSMVIKIKVPQVRIYNI